MILASPGRLFSVPDGRRTLKGPAVGDHLAGMVDTAITQSRAESPADPCQERPTLPDLHEMSVRRLPIPTRCEPQAARESLAAIGAWPSAGVSEPA